VAKLQLYAVSQRCKIKTVRMARQLPINTQQKLREQATLRPSVPLYHCIVMHELMHKRERRGHTRPTLLPGRERHSDNLAAYLTRIVVLEQLLTWHVRPLLFSFAVLLIYRTGSPSHISPTKDPRGRVRVFDAQPHDIHHTTSVIFRHRTPPFALNAPSDPPATFHLP